MVWASQTVEAPTAWDLIASEDYETWDTIHSVDTGATEAMNFKYTNFTVTSPGYYKYYAWFFKDAISSYGASGTYDGFYMREIFLNPSGRAWNIHTFVNFNEFQ